MPWGWYGIRDGWVWHCHRGQRDWWGHRKKVSPGQDTCMLKGDRADLDMEKKKAG